MDFASGQEIPYMYNLESKTNIQLMDSVALPFIIPKSLQLISGFWTKCFCENSDFPSL